MILISQIHYLHFTIYCLHSAITIFMGKQPTERNWAFGWMPGVSSFIYRYLYVHHLTLQCLPWNFILSQYCAVDCWIQALVAHLVKWMHELFFFRSLVQRNVFRYWLRPMFNYLIIDMAYCHTVWNTFLIIFSFLLHYVHLYFSSPDRQINQCRCQLQLHG